MGNLHANACMHACAHACRSWGWKEPGKNFKMRRACMRGEIWHTCTRAWVHACMHGCMHASVPIFPLHVCASHFNLWVRGCLAYLCVDRHKLVFPFFDFLFDFFSFLGCLYTGNIYNKNTCTAFTLHAASCPSPSSTNHNNTTHCK